MRDILIIGYLKSVNYCRTRQTLNFGAKENEVKILVIGDIVGRPGREAARKIIPELKQREGIEFVVANGENAAGGSGITPKIYKELLNCGIDLLITTAGLSVDPDDVTYQGLVDGGATHILYGAPILPGAMTLLARIGRVQVMGVPACALYFKTTSFDLLLPRLLAGLRITRSDLGRLANGAFCMDCKVCTFPKCPFGK